MADIDLRQKETAGTRGAQFPASGMDKHVNVAASPSDAEAVDITSADHTFTINCAGIQLSADGDVKVDMLSGTTIIFQGLVTGWHPMHITKIYKTGTATGFAASSGLIVGVSYEV